jgi:hypothetical protein
MCKVDLTSVLGTDLLELLVDILDDKLGGVLDTEVGNQSDRELALDGAGNDGLGSRGGYTRLILCLTEGKEKKDTYRKHPQYRGETDLGSLDDKLKPEK